MFPKANDAPQMSCFVATNNLKIFTLHHNIHTEEAGLRRNLPTVYQLYILHTENIIMSQ